MVQSNATTPEAYLAELPEDRRDVIAAVRELILKSLPEGYSESVSYGMLGYAIPLSRYPKTYNKQPLSYVGLAAQKNFNSLYLMCVYGNAEREAVLREGFRKIGKKLDMGKSCIHFKRLDDLPLDTIAELIASVPVEKYIGIYEDSRKK